MTSKFAIKSILAVSSVFMLSVLSPTASALVSSTTVSGCTLYKRSLGQCSVFVDGILKGLGNVSNNPTAFTVTMSKISGTIFCKNPAANALSNGTPYIDQPVALTALDPINPAQITRNGKALADIIFHDEAIIQGFIAAGVPVPDCQNANWIRVIVVTKMEILGKQIEDPSPGEGNCNLTTPPFDVVGCAVTDTLRTSCRIQDPYFFQPGLAWGVASYNYGNEDTGTGACTEICHSTDETQCNLTTPAH